MNSKIFAALALFAVSVTVCAQVQLTNLDQKSFKIDVTGQPTNVVNLNLRSTQFSPSTTGWVLTNISGVFGGSTNITTNSIWGIDGFGNITPVVTNNAVIATNIVRYGVGRMFGTESWLSKALTLTNGPNYLGAAENSQFFLIGPTTNPADCQIILSNAVATGQKLVLVNQTNAIPAEGAWTMTNNTPIPDGAGVVKLLGGYDLVSTNGYISYFEFISPDWQEVGRILASGASGLLTNVFNNIVVYSNITLRGNSTLTINNITLTTNDLWHTNLVGGAATLQPVNLGLQPLVGKGWLSGTNTPASGLLPLSLPFNVLSSVRSEDIGDPAASYMYIAQARNNNNPKSFLSFVASTNALAFQLGSNDGTDQSTMNFVTANGSDMQLTLQKNSTNFTLLYPTRGATLVPYVFGTDKTHTTNNLVEVPNNGTNLFSIDYLGEAIFGPGTTNIIYRQNGYFAIAADEGGYSLLNFGTNYGTLSSYVGSSPLGGILSTTGGQLDFGTSGGQMTFAGNLLTPGTSNTITLASSLNPWVDIYLHDGLHIGTNTLTSNGSSPSSPLWNGSALGGGGGPTLWYQYTTPDAEGGTVYGTGSTNSFFTNMVRFSNNYLTNLWGDYSGSLSIGVFTPDPATLDSGQNVAIYNIGDSSGSSMVSTNSFNIYNVGNNAGRSFSSQASRDIFNFGLASSGNGVSTNSSSILNLGFHAGENSRVTNSQNLVNIGLFSGTTTITTGSSGLFNFGYDSGQVMTSTRSHNIFNYGWDCGFQSTNYDSSQLFNLGFASGDGQYITNSTYIVNLGASAGALMLSTNSSYLFNIGHEAGYSMVSDAFSSEIYNVGDGAGKGATYKASSSVASLFNQAMQNSIVTNSSKIMALNGSLQNASLTNSQNIVGMGDTAGNGIAGSFTNMVFMGSGSTASPGSANQVVIGPGMSFVMGTNTISTNGASPSLPLWNGSTWPISSSPTFTGTVTITNGSTGNLLNLNGSPSETWPFLISSNGVSQVGFTNSGQLLIAAATSSKPAIASISDTTSGINISSSAVNFAGGGGSLGGISASSGWNCGAYFFTWNGDTFLTRESAAVFQFGKDAASPVSPQMLKMADGSGTDKSGSTGILAAGQSTGAGVPGDLIFQTSLYTNSSGSTANAYLTRAQIIGRPCALTNTTATSFQRFTMATNTQAGIKLFCTVKATDAAFARQSISSDVRVDAVNINGTITATVSETDNTLAASTGTLTIAYTVVDEGSNVLAIRANANTSLTATPSIKWVIQSINSDGAIIVTPVQL